jgi:hypothetical protein
LSRGIWLPSLGVFCAAGCQSHERQSQVLRWSSELHAACSWKCCDDLPRPAKLCRSFDYGYRRQRQKGTQPFLFQGYCRIQAAGYRDSSRRQVGFKDARSAFGSGLLSLGGLEAWRHALWGERRRAITCLRCRPRRAAFEVVESNRRALCQFLRTVRSDTPFAVQRTIDDLYNNRLKIMTPVQQDGGVSAPVFLKRIDTTRSPSRSYSPSPGYRSLI